MFSLGVLSELQITPCIVIRLENIAHIKVYGLLKVGVSTLYLEYALSGS